MKAYVWQAYQAKLEKVAFLQKDEADEEKRALNHKFTSMKLNLGIPKEAFDDTYLDEYYDKLKIQSGDSWFTVSLRTNIFHIQ